MAIWFLKTSDVVFIAFITFDWRVTAAHTLETAELAMRFVLNVPMVMVAPIDVILVTFHFIGFAFLAIAIFTAKFTRNFDPSVCDA